MDQKSGSSEDYQGFTTRYIPQGPIVKHEKEDWDRTLYWIPDYLYGTCIVISLSAVLGVLWCEDDQKVNSIGHMIPRGVSQYTLTMGEINFVVVLSNAQMLDKSLSIYYWVCEVIFYIPKGTWKSIQYTDWYMEELQSLGMQCRQTMTAAMLDARTRL